MSGFSATQPKNTWLSIIAEKRLLTRELTVTSVPSNTRSSTKEWRNSSNCQIDPQGTQDPQKSMSASCLSASGVDSRKWGRTAWIISLHLQCSTVKILCIFIFYSQPDSMSSQCERTGVGGQLLKLPNHTKTSRVAQQQQQKTKHVWCRNMTPLFVLRGRAAIFCELKAIEEDLQSSSWRVSRGSCMLFLCKAGKGNDQNMFT